MKNLLALALLLTTSLSLPAQTYVSVEQQNTTGAAVITFLLGITAPYSTTNYKITYNTTDVFGQPTVASGLLSIPQDLSNAYPLAIYNHGTVTNREAVPSRTTTPERFVPVGLAANGYITVAPDYLGLGDNLGIHPYVHAESEASAGRDLLLAARQWLGEQGIAYNDQLFLTGYSQGGHATQALHRDLQLNPADDDLEVTAATHLSGPYSISDVMRNTLFTDDRSTMPGFIVYTYISYDYVYDLYDDFNEIFNEEYVPNIDSLSRDLITVADFNIRLEQQLAASGERLEDLLQPNVREELRTKDPNSPTVQALIQNDTYDWAPEAPTLILYCSEDEQVPFRNSIIADSVMRANGSTSVTLENGGPLTHGDCVNPAIVATLEFFGNLAEINPVSLGEVVAAPDVTLSPNPARASEPVTLRGLSSQPHGFVLYDIAGRETARGTTDASGRLRLPATVPAGVQVLRVEVGDGTSLVRRLIVR